jgi:hypothetical protein
VRDLTLNAFCQMFTIFVQAKQVFFTIPHGHQLNAKHTFSQKASKRDSVSF